MFTIPNVRDLITMGGTIVRVPRTPDHVATSSPGEHIGSALVRRADAVWGEIDGKVVPIYVIGTTHTLKDLPMQGHYSSLAMDALRQWIGDRDDVVRLSYIAARPDCWLLFFTIPVD